RDTLVAMQAGEVDVAGMRERDRSRFIHGAQGMLREMHRDARGNNKVCFPAFDIQVLVKVEGGEGQRPNNRRRGGRGGRGRNRGRNRGRGGGREEEREQRPGNQKLVLSGDFPLQEEFSRIYRLCFDVGRVDLFRGMLGSINQHQCLMWLWLTGDAT
ncbi:hypothetical protein KIPB_017263, partial [Kipferlia bialata]